MLFSYDDRRRLFGGSLKTNVFCETSDNAAGLFFVFVRLGVHSNSLEVVD
jgi:hypothetical protein